MAPIRLGLVAPLTDTDTAIAFLLHRGHHAHYRWFLRLAELATAGLFLAAAFRGEQGSSCRLDILQVVMTQVLGVLGLLLNQLVCKLLAGSLVLGLLIGSIV